MCSSSSPLEIYHRKPSASRFPHVVGAMARRWHHGSWKEDGGGRSLPPAATTTSRSSSTASSWGQRSQVPVAGAASVIAVVDCGEGHLGDAHSIRHSTDMGRVTSVAAPGYVDGEVASNPSSIRVSARPISVAKFRSSGANYRVADGGDSHDCHSIQRPAVGSCHVVGAAMLPVRGAVSHHRMGRPHLRPARGSARAHLLARPELARDCHWISQMPSMASRR